MREAFLIADAKVHVDRRMNQDQTPPAEQTFTLPIHSPTPSDRLNYEKLNTASVRFAFVASQLRCYTLLLRAIVSYDSHGVRPQEPDSH